MGPFLLSFYPHAKQEEIKSSIFYQIHYEPYRESKQFLEALLHRWAKPHSELPEDEESVAEHSQTDTSAR